MGDRGADAPRAGALGQAGRRRVEQCFEVDGYARRVEEVLDQVVRR